MSRIIEHICRNPSCGGGNAKWSGTALFCTSCDAWQRDKVTLVKKSDPVPEATKSRIWTDIETEKRSSVEFECPLCGIYNHTPNWKKIDESVFRVECKECSSICIIRES